MNEPNSAMIPLTKGFSAIIDAEDLPVVEKYTWFASTRRGNRVYAATTLIKSHQQAGKPQKIYMHRLVMNETSATEIDHINRNGLDNRKSNLRRCDGSINRMNSGKRSGAKYSTYRGVTYRPDRKRWQGRIQFRGKNISKLFATEQEAVQFYKDTAKRLMGNGYTETYELASKQIS